MPDIARLVHAQGEFRAPTAPSTSGSDVDVRGAAAPRTPTYDTSTAARSPTNRSAKNAKT